MAAPRQARWLPIMCALILAVQSCAGTKSRQSPERPAREPAQTAAAARRHIDAGEYEKAIDEFRAARRGRPQDRELAMEYARALEDIKAVADRATDGEDFASAGRIYNELLKGYPSFKDLAPTLSFDRAHLSTEFSYCKQSLGVRGFQEYRKGNIGEAIALWRSLLEIDPDNADIRGAVRTATLQQKNLEERAADR